MKQKIRTINRNTKVVTIEVNHDDRIVEAVVNRYWPRGKHRKDYAPQRSGVEQVEIVLRRFNRKLSSKELFKGFEQEGLEPCTFEEIRDLEHATKKWGRPCFIAALGSWWYGPVGAFLVLCIWESNRYLPDGPARYVYFELRDTTDIDGEEWDEGTWFACRRRCV